MKPEQRFDFPKLEALRLLVRQILQDQVTSLNYYAYAEGFQHYKGVNKISVSSSATCVLSLIATGSWLSNKQQTKALLQYLLSKTASAGLDKDNPFTIAWILEAVTALQGHSDPLEPAEDTCIADMERILENSLRNGCVSIAPYPPSAYLTQLVIRVLHRRAKLSQTLTMAVKDWAWQELPKQLVLIQAKSKTADPFAVAYLLMVVTAVTPRSQTSPEQTRIQRYALNTFFSCQLPDGTWPLSQPLFHYANFGNAHCYEYEMLAQLLQEPALQELLLDYLPELSIAAEFVSHSGYELEDGVRAWSSGHHPQLAGPESWTTASVYHFAHRLDRLLAEAVRRELFRHLETPFPRPGPRGTTKADFAKDFLDSAIYVRGTEQSLKDFLWKNFVEPLAAEADGIVEGRRFSKDTPRSAIFFGPPGTSKTELSKDIAKFLGWPHLAIDPSHLLRNGMEALQAEANIIFRMLEETERSVVLFDEFDEMVRERGSPDGQPFSRLLTTAMLPKLASIHRRATLIFIIATNNIGEFDLAIQRPGRFDRVIQIMPPTYKAKVNKKDWGPEKNLDLEALLQRLGAEQTEPVKEQLEDLTYAECDAFVTEISKLPVSSQPNPQRALSILDGYSERCTLQSRAKPEAEHPKWRERCREERNFNR